MNNRLQDKQWKEFNIRDIFDVAKGVYLPQKKIRPGNIPYITAKSVNNGVTDFIENKPLFKGNCITIGKVDLSAYYQPTSFYCSHDVSVITNSQLNKYNGLFICKMISRQGFKYSYGRQAQLNVVASEKVFLPTNPEGQPDYIFMENYEKQLEQERLNRYEEYAKNKLQLLNYPQGVESLEAKKWGEFNIGYIFSEIQRGKRLKKADHKKGQIPYVSSTANNNGIDSFIADDQGSRMFNSCLTIANSGSVGATFYHPYSFIASDHVTSLKNNQLSESIYKFISTILKRTSEKYSFNREINDSRIRREKVMLPLNTDGEPDYVYMENYVKKLEYEQLTKYLNYKKLN